MRTTVRIDEELLREAKLQAARRGTTLTALIEDTLREYLARQNDVRRGELVRLVTFGDKGLYPGVDLDDSAALFDLIKPSCDPD